MHKAIAVCGQICSGKSSTIDNLSKSYEWDIISFGKYVKYIASVKGLAASREVYQILGQEIFNERGALQFLHDVIEFNQPISDIHLYDSIRHISVINALEEVYADSLVIYLNVNDKQRYERFKTRAALGDPPLNFEEFLALSSHPIEQGIPTIANAAEFVIDGSRSFQEIVSEIKQALIDKQFIIKK